MNKPRLVPQSYAAVPILAATDRRLKRVDWAVLAAISFHADTRGYCYPSQDRIAALTGLSRQTVNRSVRQLREFGYLKIVMPSKSVRRSGGRFAVNGYIVVREPLPKKERRVAAAGDMDGVTRGDDNSMSSP